MMTSTHLRIAERAPSTAHWTSLAIALLATSCAPGGASSAPVLRVDEGKLGARMALLHRLTEETPGPGDKGPGEHRGGTRSMDRTSSLAGGFGGAGPEPLAAPAVDR